MFERFTDRAIKAIMLAQEEARRLGHNLVGTEQILLGMLCEGTDIATIVLNNFGITLESARAEVENLIGRGYRAVPAELPFTPKAKRIFDQSFKEGRQLGHTYIGTEHLLLAITQDEEGVAAKVIENLDVELGDIRSAVIKAMGEVAAASKARAQGSSFMGERPANKASLEEFGRNLTQLALEGKLDPVVGRAKEIERVIQILGRRTKNNPVLIGEPGVGKTAIAEGLATRIANNDVPEPLQGTRLVSLDLGGMLAGAQFRGEFEERLKKIMDEIRTAGNVILVIDEVHTLIGAGAAEGAIDAANILKPALARGELQCIGATTLDEYRKIEKDQALERRFAPVYVDQPSTEDAIKILRGLKPRYEAHHNLQITDEAIVAAVNLSNRYISDRFLPDKAIDLMDEAASKVRLEIFSLPPDLREMESKLKEMDRQMEEASAQQDYAEAMFIKGQKVALQEEYEG